MCYSTRFQSKLPCWSHRDFSLVLVEVGRSAFHLKEHMISIETYESTTDWKLSQTLMIRSHFFTGSITQTTLDWRRLAVNSAFKSHKLGMGQWKTYYEASIIIMQIFQLYRKLIHPWQTKYSVSTAGLLSFRRVETWNIWLLNRSYWKVASVVKNWNVSVHYVWTGNSRKRETSIHDINQIVCQNFRKLNVYQDHLVWQDELSH